MTVIGVLGSPTRATVTPWGAVSFADGPSLDWWVAADDRWHTPSVEPSVRQRRLDGAPVVETAVRVPSGDVVHTAYAVADAGGLVVLAIENRSSLPVAVAFSPGRLVMAERAPTAVPIVGIEVPADTVVFPVAHRTHVRLGVGASATIPRWARLPSPEQVAAAG